MRLHTSTTVANDCSVHCVAGTGNHETTAYVFRMYISDAVHLIAVRDILFFRIPPTRGNDQVVAASPGNSQVLARLPVSY